MGVIHEPIRVLIAEDSATFRHVIRSVMEAEDDIIIVAEAADGEEAIALVTEHAPSVVVMDIRMPKLSGIDATRALNQLHPTTRVLMLTISDDEQDLFEAIKAGASGYLLKDTDPDDVVTAVRRINAGQATLSPAVAAKLKSDLTTTLMYGELTPGMRPLLTKPELDVLRQLADGISSKTVGERLEMSEATVGAHLYSIMTKLHLHDRMSAVARAVREELTGGSVSS